MSRQRDGPGDLGPQRRLISVGLPVAGLEAGALSGLEHLAGQLVAVGGLGLDQVRRLDLSGRVHAPASISRSRAGSVFGEVQLSISASTSASTSGVICSGSG